jgi:hypothetical protein
MIDHNETKNIGGERTHAPLIYMPLGTFRGEDRPYGNSTSISYYKVPTGDGPEGSMVMIMMRCSGRETHFWPCSPARGLWIGRAIGKRRPCICGQRVAVRLAGLQQHLYAIVSYRCLYDYLASQGFAILRGAVGPLVKETGNLSAGKQDGEEAAFRKSLR